MSVNLSSDYANGDFRIRWRIDSYGSRYHSCGWCGLSDWIGFHFDNVRIDAYDSVLPNLVYPQIPNGGDYVQWLGPPSTQQNVTTSTSAGNIVIQFPAGVEIYKDGEPYRGDFYAPYVVEIPASDLGMPSDPQYLLALEIGLEDEELTFSAPVRILIPGEAGRQVGWSRLGVFHEITTQLEADDGSLLDSLGVEDGYLDVGEDLVIWTKHLTIFVVFGDVPPAQDSDGDGIPDDTDNCPSTYNPDQADADGDGYGDACDVCPLDPDNDIDGDEVCGDIDNCPDTFNPDQTDNDSDAYGDVCDPDDDNDGVDDISDNCPWNANADQADFDEDGIGDMCDDDIDNDGVLGSDDQCPFTSLGEVVDGFGCSIADWCRCDSDWKNHGAYVSCVARTSENFLTDGLISEAEKDAVVSTAAQSECGKK